MRDQWQPGEGGRVWVVICGVLFGHTSLSSTRVLRTSVFSWRQGSSLNQVANIPRIDFMSDLTGRFRM